MLRDAPFLLPRWFSASDVRYTVAANLMRFLYSNKSLLLHHSHLLKIPIKCSSKKYIWQQPLSAWYCRWEVNIFKVIFLKISVPVDLATPVATGGNNNCLLKYRSHKLHSKQRPLSLISRNTKSIIFFQEVIMVSIAKFGPSNKCAGGHFGNYCSVNKIWRLIVALMSVVWSLIDSCDWQFAYLLLSSLWDSQWVRLLSQYFSKLMLLDLDTCPVSTI